MASNRENSGTQIEQSVIQRVITGVQYAISGITPSTWFSPQQPLTPIAPQAENRALDFPAGYNLRIAPKSYEGISFNELRGFANSYDLLRLVIETRKDQIEAFDFEIISKDGKSGNAAEIKRLTDIFHQPSIEYNWSNWLRALLEDLFIIDAVAIYPRMNKGGGIFSLDLIDAGTIKRNIDETGRTPMAPDPAYSQCYSKDTEVLTKKGWKKFQDVDINVDEFATQNVDTKMFEWQKASQKIEKFFSGDLLNFTSRFMDVCVSPEHRMLISRLPRDLGGNPKRKGSTFVSAEYLANVNNLHNINIPLKTEWLGQEIKTKFFGDDQYFEEEKSIVKAKELRNSGETFENIGNELGIATMTAYKYCTKYELGSRKKSKSGYRNIEMSGDDFCSFMGAFLSEGCISNNRGVISISQKEYSKGFEEYKNLLNRINGRLVNYSADINFQISSIKLADYLKPFGLQRNRYIPDEIMNATEKQLKLFWKFFWLGDGSGDSDIKNTRLHTSSKVMVDQLQEIAQKIGYIANVKEKPASSSIIIENGVQRVINRGVQYTLNARKAVDAVFSKVEKIPYSDNIYCLTVPNSTLYVRRNGKPIWCGNCLHGLPAVDYSTDTLIYKMRNPRTYRLYGLSPVEQVIMTVNIAIRRQISQLQYYSEGNIPEAFASTPESWSIEQVRMFQGYWDSVMEGSQAEKRKMKFMPAGMDKITMIKSDPLKDNYDEWLSRIICFAFSIPPTAFVTQQNRATAQSAAEAAKEEGLMPLMKWLKGLFDFIIQKHLDSPNMEFKWKVESIIDPVSQSQIDDRNIRNGSMSIDEIREKNGLKKLGVPNLIFTGAGATKLEDIINPPKVEQPVMPQQPVNPKPEKPVPDSTAKFEKMISDLVSKPQPDINISLGDNNISIPDISSITNIENVIPEIKEEKKQHPKTIKVFRNPDGSMSGEVSEEIEEPVVTKRKIVRKKIVAKKDVNGNLTGDVSEFNDE